MLGNNLLTVYNEIFFFIGIVF